MLLHSAILTTLGGRLHYSLHFTDKKTEAQRDLVISLESNI